MDFCFKAMDFFSERIYERMEFETFIFPCFCLEPKWHCMNREHKGRLMPFQADEWRFFLGWQFSSVWFLHPCLHFLLRAQRRTGGTTNAFSMEALLLSWKFPSIWFDYIQRTAPVSFHLGVTLWEMRQVLFDDGEETTYVRWQNQLCTTSKIGSWVKLKFTLETCFIILNWLELNFWVKGEKV